MEMNKKPEVKRDKDGKIIPPKPEPKVILPKKKPIKTIRRIPIAFDACPLLPKDTDIEYSKCYLLNYFVRECTPHQ